MALRVVALLTFAVGLALASNMVGGPPYTTVHLLLGLATVVLALAVFAPRLRQGLGTGLPAWFPLLPLALGLGWYFGFWQRLFGSAGFVVLLVHALLGIIAVGLIEMGIARARRAGQATSEQR